LVRAPEVNGEYEIELDLVQEHVTWFAEQGSPLAKVNCVVEGGRPPEPRAPQRPPLGRRFPRVHRVLAALGLDDIRRFVGRAGERLRAEYRRPTMEMYCLPRAVVVDLVEAQGGHILAVDRELSGDGFQNFRYWVTRPSPDR
jgi:hypothetical protein